MNREMVYQARVTQPSSLGEVAGILAGAALGGLQGMKEFRGPNNKAALERLRRDLSRVFERRLSTHAGCAACGGCRGAIGVYGGRPEGAPEHIYLLSLQGGLIRFVERLAALACRRFKIPARHEKTIGSCQGVLHRALAPYLYFNDECIQCLLRGRNSK